MSARYNENVDINFMNFLSTYNMDYYNFIREIINMVETRMINSDFFDNFDNKANLYKGFFSKRN